MATTIDALSRPEEAHGDEPVVRSRRRIGLRRPAIVACGLILVAGVILRFWTSSDLWLDEALSVNIAKLPLRQLPAALRHDGAPPLYYVLLHFWMRAFGQGDFAVRALSGLASMIALPFAWLAGRRLGGRTCAWATLVLTATSPFAIAYATTTRMYSFMILWSLLGLLALARALERPTRGTLACVALSTAVILYTHYWGLYLVAVTGVWLLLRARRAEATVARSSGEERNASRRCLIAMVIGSLPFLAWVPIFVFQTFHTGTPWSNPAGPGDILGVLGEYSGGGPWGAALGLALFTLLLLGLFGRPIDGTRVLIELRARHRARPVAWVFIGTLGLAVLAGAIAQAAFVGRYTAVVFPMFMLLAGLGAAVFLNPRVMAGALAVTSMFGLIVSVTANSNNRTEAASVAAVINQEANPGDLVLYCPDQLAPAVDRLLHAPVQQATFPRGIGPQRVDWVDYRKVIANTSVDRFGQQMLARAGPGHAIWYVWRQGYPGTNHKCTELMSLLNSQRPVNQQLVKLDNSDYEYEALVRFAG
ncbi:MAG TPA: glycosyltransferase family 39 protein [Acidimicrobiales bacterium]|nr:glycosyltransferase family 39 protein [Acidimicrobiales bacterium]